MRAKKELRYLLRKRKVLKQQMRHYAHQYALTASLTMQRHWAGKIEEAHANFRHNEQRIEAHNR